MRERRLIFGEDAAGYDAGRPSYPPALIDQLVALAGPAARVIDVGAGTAKGTRLLAARGLTGVAVEPDPAMAAVARSHLAPYEGWRVDVSDFEWWCPSPDDAPADLVTSSQAWHWVHPVVGTWRAHRLLRPGGHVAVWWTLADDDDSPVRQQIDAVYDEHAPGEVLSPMITFQREDPFADTLDDAPLVSSESRAYRWTQTYTSAELVALLGTHSNHRLMPEAQRTRLFAAIIAVVDAAGGSFDLPYITRLWTARRPE